MNSGKWNRKPKRILESSDKEKFSKKLGLEEPYKVSRIRPKKKKRKHPGYTLIPKHQHWIFNSNKINGG